MHPISETLCAVYDSLLEEGEVAFPLHKKQRHAIDSIVKTVNGTWFGVQRFNTHQRRAAAYFCYIIKDHPVTDGNKRLSVLWLQIYVDTFGLQIRPGVSLDVLAVSVEKTESPIEELINMTEVALFEKTST